VQKEKGKSWTTAEESSPEEAERRGCKEQHARNHADDDSYEEAKCYEAEHPDLLRSLDT